MLLKTLCNIEATFLHGFHLLLQGLGYRTQLFDLDTVPFLRFHDRRKLALDSVERRNNRPIGLLTSVALTYRLGHAPAYRLGHTPAYRLGVLCSIGLRCGFDPHRWRWDVMATAKRPRVRTVRATLGLACRANADYHQAFAVPWASPATGEPQGLRNHRGWGCRRGRGRCGRWRRGRFRDHCATAVPNRSRGEHYRARRARLRGRGGRGERAPGRWCGLDTHTSRSVEALGLLRYRQSAMQRR